MDIENLIDRMKKARANGSWNTLPDLSHKAATALEQLQAENDRLKEIIFCYCDMCIEQDGVLWCQSCDEKCDYCIHPKEASHD